jgi:5-methylcytosine-specific restriction endonuclease McrA
VSIPARVRTALQERANDCCEICGELANNAHHRKNRSQGGEDLLSNLLLLCGSGTTGCHGWVTAHPAASYVHGWSVRSYDDPRSVPVSGHYGHWWILRDNGDRIPASVGGVAS